MIQISPQVDSSAHAGKAPELKSEAPEQGSLKKDKLGVFAKLLEGLIGAKGSDKGKSPLLKGENSLADGLEAEKSADGGKAKGKNGKKGALFADGEIQNTEAALALLDLRGPPPELTLEQLLDGEEADDQLSDLAETAGKEALTGKKITGKATAADAVRLKAGSRNTGSQNADLQQAELAQIAGLSPEETPDGAGAELLRGKALTDKPDIPPEKVNPKDRSLRGVPDQLPAEGLQLAGLKKAGLIGLGNEEAGKLSESKNSKRLRDSKDKDKINLLVRDLRSAGGLENAALTGAVEAKRELSVNGIHESELVVTLGQGETPEDRSAAGNISAPGMAFEDMLARELHQNLNGDIVRHASIILKDGGEGSIKLSLRPESLGNVKIRLEMADNKITGHIVLESSEALRAFEREIRSLEQAFRDSGFESANLDMSLTSDQWSADSGGQNNGQREDGGMYPRPELVASRYESAAEIPVPGASGAFNAASSREAVNMLV